MAINDIRFYLCGVLVEVLPDQVRLVAADGHRMLVAKQDRTPETDMHAHQFIIPDAIVAQINKHKWDVPELAIEYCDTELDYRVHLQDTKVSFRAIDAKYPDYVRPIPDTADGKIAQFDPEYLIGFQKAARVYSKKGLYTIGHNGDRAALIALSTAPHVVGVIMPIRSDPPMMARPDWLNPKLAADA
jgi:DNA polymerase III sliding clamp (beta) subunit (PCNA family)